MRLCFPELQFPIPSSHFALVLFVSLRALTLSPVTCHLPIQSLVTSAIILLAQSSSFHLFSSSLLPLPFCTIQTILTAQSCPFQSLIFILEQDLPFVKMAAPGRPQFFCTRPDGSLTPLVAVDELPANVTIHGAPRIITAGETQGMTSCGLATQRAEPWSVEGYPKSSEAALPDMHSLLVQLITDKNVPEDMQASAKAILFKEIDSGRAGQGTPTNGLSPTAPTFQAKNNHVGNKHVWPSDHGML